MITIDEIEKLTTLSRLSLSHDEKELMRDEFDSILNYIDSIQKISTASTKRARSIVATVNVMREDTPLDGRPHESGIFTEALVSAAPKREGNYIKVKKIL